MATDAYLTGAGYFLPGEPLDNDEIARRLGAPAGGAAAATRAKVLATNGIQTRHYALDGDGVPTMLNEQLAAQAVQRALHERGIGQEQVGMLAAATTQGDLLVPGFGSMVHGRLGGGPLEVLSAGGVCASSVAALGGRCGGSGSASTGSRWRSALSCRAGRCGSPRYADRPSFDAEFLRWTLSDGAVSELGDRAVIEHDLNVYEVLVALGSGAEPHRLQRVPSAALDTSMLVVPPLDVEPATRRWLRLDIQTALCLMNIPFALCLTPREYRRAVHSLRLDESLLAVLATLTGDCTFRSWRPVGTMVRVDSWLDVPRAVYEHAVVCEHAKLRNLARPR